MPRIAVIPGDGVGQEVIPAAQSVLEVISERFGLDLTFHHYPLGAEHYLETGETLPDHVFEELRDHRDAIFLGALGDPRVPTSVHARDILLGLRRRLDLFINFRPARLLNLSLCPLKIDDVSAVDFVVFRENTQGIYGGSGGALHKGTASEIATEVMIYSASAVERIIRAAFEYAAKRGKRVCMVDKSNAMRNVGDLWLRIFAEVARDYPETPTRHLYVDAAAMHLVRDPSQFDVIVTSNLFGDVLSDIAAALQGGMGVAASANLSPNAPGLFEPVHGSAPDIAGQGLSDPTAALLTGALMLEHLGFAEAAAALEAATVASVNAG